ncbi:MAG: tetratricopeptide repeat protein [Paraglaciecola sp.]|uniref:tetratricopeptide repeat protein n=1 Tax=Paraglaciecola sp. TaxID=1920173 RepID=UPI003297DC10
MKILVLFFLFVSLSIAASVEDKQTREFERALKQAQQGDEIEIYNTAYYYQLGLGINVNLAEAKKWFKKAELTKNGAVHYKLGRLYETGTFFERNMMKAVKHYHLSAKQSDPLGMNNYGLLLLKGQGITKNEIEGIRWLKKAANARMPESSLNLGLYYQSKNNINEAKIWFEKAAKIGNIRARVVLAGIYRKERNYEEALIHYRSAAEENNSEAQYYLALMADKGLGMERSPTIAKEWLEASAKNGFKKASRVLERTRASKNK